jgi:hypothetical protein
MTLRRQHLPGWQSVPSTHSKSSPSPLDVPVRLACFPSTLSNVEYLDSCQLDKFGGLNYIDPCRRNGCRKSKRIVHIHPHPKGKAIVKPCWSLNTGNSLAERLNNETGKAHTGPIKSGMKITTNATFATTNRNPSRVTILGANHNGNSSTKAFHFQSSATSAT